MEKAKNTLTKGSYRWILFHDAKDKTWYGVAMEFNIVVSGDTQVLAFAELQEAVAGYIEGAQKIKGIKDFSFLNQKPDPEYIKLWNILQKGESIPSPYHVGSFGMCPAYA